MGKLFGANDQAKKAAEAAERQANELRKSTEAEKLRLQKSQDKSNAIFQRAMRARGGGYFESDNSSTLG